MSSEINLITDMSLIKSELNGYKTIYVEGGGKTISQFMQKNILNRIHICLCPIILGVADHRLFRINMSA